MTANPTTIAPAATAFDLQVLAADFADAVKSAVESHRCHFAGPDGLPATVLTGDEDADFVAEFRRDYLPLVAVWRAATAATSAADALTATGLPYPTQTYRSAHGESLASATPAELAAMSR